MLTRRVIACLDVKGGRVVKGVHFEGLREVGDPVELATRYEAQGADEIVFLDISASREERATLLDVVRRTAQRLFIPLTVGGGIRSADDVARVLRAGADKASINTAAVERPAVLAESARRFGSQCVVASIDAAGWGNDPHEADSRETAVARAPAGRRIARGTGDGALPGGPAVRGTRAWRVHTHGGSVPTDLEAVAWARECVRLGAGEILLTSIDRDGGRSGYDLELTRAVAEAVAVPVIASGGAGASLHLADAIERGGADAVLVAGILHDGRTSIAAIKRDLESRGIPVRPAA